MTETRKNLETLAKDSVFRFTQANGQPLPLAFVKGQKLLFTEELMKFLQEHFAMGKISELASGGVDCQFMGNGVPDWTPAKLVINVQVIINEEEEIGEALYKSEYS